MIRLPRIRLLVALLSLSLQAGNAGAGAIVPNIVVTHPVMLPLVEALLDGVTRPEAVLPRAVDAHSALLSPSEVAKLNEADIIIAADDSITPALTPWLKEKKNKRAMVLVISHYEEAQPLKYRRQNPFLPHEKTAYNDKIDAHIWLDPLRMAGIMMPLAKDIAKYSPEYAAKLSDNAQHLALHLRAVTYPKTQDTINQALQEEARFTPAYPIIPVLTQHDAFQYFYARYNVTDGGFLMRHSGPLQGASSQSALYSTAAKHRVRCIMNSEPNRLVDRVRDITKARLVLLNPEKPVTSRDVPAEGWFTNDYDRFIANVTRQFAACLR